MFSVRQELTSPEQKAQVALHLAEWKDVDHIERSATQHLINKLQIQFNLEVADFEKRAVNKIKKVKQVYVAPGKDFLVARVEKTSLRRKAAQQNYLILFRIAPESFIECDSIDLNKVGTCEHFSYLGENLIFIAENKKERRLKRYSYKNDTFSLINSQSFDKRYAPVKVWPSLNDFLYLARYKSYHHSDLFSKMLQLSFCQFDKNGLRVIADMGETCMASPSEVFVDPAGRLIYLGSKHTGSGCLTASWQMRMFDCYSFASQTLFDFTATRTDGAFPCHSFMQNIFCLSSTYLPERQSIHISYNASSIFPHREFYVPVHAASFPYGANTCAQLLPQFPVVLTELIMQYVPREMAQAHAAFFPLPKSIGILEAQFEVTERKARHQVRTLFPELEEIISKAAELNSPHDLLIKKVILDVVNSLKKIMTSKENLSSLNYFLEDTDKALSTVGVCPSFSLKASRSLQFFGSPESKVSVLALLHEVLRDLRMIEADRVGLSIENMNSEQAIVYHNKK
jgi:hypothetical protein